MLGRCCGRKVMWWVKLCVEKCASGCSSSINVLCVGCNCCVSRFIRVDLFESLWLRIMVK